MRQADYQSASELLDDLPPQIPRQAGAHAYKAGINDASGGHRPHSFKTADLQPLYDEGYAYATRLNVLIHEINTRHDATPLPMPLKSTTSLGSIPQVNPKTRP